MEDIHEFVHGQSGTAFRDGSGRLMIFAIAKIAIAAAVITFSSWLASKKPALAGFVLALPVSSLLALAFFYTEYRDTGKAATFAKSIFVSVPLSLTFFLPFLFAERSRIPFWGNYFLGLAFLTLSYALHRKLFA